MESAVKGIEDYTCEVEQFFYQNGVEDQSYRFKFYFKRKKRIRVDFSHPYSSLTIFYSDGDKEATVMPFRFISSLKLRLSIDNPMIKTLAGQRIDQTDMEYFVDFMSKNLKRINQGEEEFFKEDGEQVKFLFWAKDYIEEKSAEKYRISISKKHWLPIRIGGTVWKTDCWKRQGSGITSSTPISKISCLIHDKLHSPTLPLVASRTCLPLKGEGALCDIRLRLVVDNLGFRGNYFLYKLRF